MTGTSEAKVEKRELAYRATDGMEVSLLWDPSDDSLTVTVTNWKTGDVFDVAARRDNALEVFRHPYVHAARRQVGRGAGTVYVF
jgi:hypothetical protein